MADERADPATNSTAGTRRGVLGGSLRVPWGELDPKKYEDLVSAFLSLQHPTTRRVDGSGGDSGCDVAFPTSDGLEVFELKSWTGRLSPGRRRQLADSLRTAERLNPVSWHAVVPVDLTPKEHGWFAGLTAGMPFPCEWLGRTWLDARFAGYPHLIRYFCGSASDELLDALRDFHQEQASLAGGVTDGIARLQVLAQRIDDLNPFHQVRIVLDGGEVAISSQPRYPGAEQDAPMTIEATFVFPGTEEGRAAAQEFRRFVDYGDPVEVGPEYIDAIGFSELLGHHGPGEYSFRGGGDQTVDIAAAVLIFQDIDSEDDVLASLPIRLTTVRGGELGSTTSGADASGVLSVTAVLDRGAGSTSMTVHFDAVGVMPQAGLAACHLLSHMTPGRAIGIRFDDTGHVLGPFTLTGDILGFVSNAELIVDLDELQRRTGHLFATPPGLTPADHDDIREALQLLNGGTITESWSEITLQGIPSKVPDLVDLLAGKGHLTVMSTSDLDLAGHLIPLGVLAQTFMGATPADPEGVLTAAASAGPSDSVPVRLVPSGDPIKSICRMGDARRVEDVPSNELSADAGGLPSADVDVPSVSTETRDPVPPAVA